MRIELRALTRAHFFSALANRWIDADQLERDSPQAKYILSYLQKPQVGALCFVIEERYVDGDYLEDFSSFYVSSFPPYERYCKRLHFFDRNFSQDEINEILVGDDLKAAKALQDSYVGFIVVRPLPRAVIGRTVLRTYSDEPDRRFIPTLRLYKPYLNGIPLSIESLAFEEQDSSVAACATVALWSAFHKTHELFGSQRPRPATITKAANVVRAFGRAMPSGGLNPMQIGEAVRAVGLEPEFYAITPKTPAASLAYAYLSAGIPLILGGYIEGLDFHAVTVVGYSKPDNPSNLPEPTFNEVTSAPGQRIDKFYLHDDGVGPFAVAPIRQPVKGLIVPGQRSEPPILLESDWKLSSPVGNRQTAYFLPEWLIVPAYTKMRVSYFSIHGWIRRLTRMFTHHRLPFGHMGFDVDQLSWDIRLALVNDFKEQLRKDLWNNPAARTLSQEHLPRFLWIATMRDGDTPSRMLIFDGTDTERTCPLLHTIWLDDRYKAILDALFANDLFTKTWRVPLTPQFFDALKTGCAAFLKDLPEH